MPTRLLRHFSIYAALLLLVGFSHVVPSVYAQGAQKGPPATFPSGFLPVVFSRVTGVMRVVRPWGVAGASIPNCTPPAAWAINPPYDATLCNEGGSFDARPDENYMELQL